LQRQLRQAYLANEGESKQRQLVARAFSDGKAYGQLYEGATPVAHFFAQRLERVLEFLSHVEGGKLLEVGCGPGILLTRLRGGQFQLFGLDSSPEMIAEAKARNAEHDVSLTVGRLEQLPFRPASFDVVLALGVLEYLPDLRASLTEIARLAKPNAVVIASMLNRLSLCHLWDRFIWRPWKSLRHLLRGRRTEPTLWLHGQRSLLMMMMGCQLETVDAVYFNLNVCLPPFDSKYPERALALNRWVEAHGGRWFRRMLHTGFIVKARKTGD
jgi:2-polyprenyl-3-methyl-5-hydroxy-6-metoxy-1,4-benzoquinol methylase